MLASVRFKLNHPQIVYETFEGEVIAINLDSGTYYSMTGLSATIWSWLVGGASLASVRDALIASCDGEAATMEADLRAFATKLQDQRLLVSDETAMGEDLPVKPMARMSHQPLALDIFTDLQDLLLLDPIHDVEEEGWPLASTARRT